MFFLIAYGPLCQYNRSRMKQYKEWIVRGSIPTGTTLNTLTYDQWRVASQWEKDAFLEHWARQGALSFACLTCGMPSVRGVGSCPACRDLAVSA